MNALELAEAVRSTCVATTVAAYEDAGVQGLCPDGRWEAAVGALRQIDLRALVQRWEGDGVPPDRTARGTPPRRP